MNLNDNNYNRGTVNGNSATKTKNGSFFRSNPVLNRLNKVDERTQDDGSATYGGIALKTAFMLLWTIAGMMLYLWLEKSVFSGQADIMRFNYRGFEVSASAMQLGFFVGAGILAIVMQLLAAFVRVTIPVTGTIYSLCQGFIISFLVFTVLQGYEYLGILALAITVVVVFAMALLYTKGIIKVSRKFHMIILTLVAAMIGISIVTFIGYLIPFTRGIVSQIIGHPGISFALTLISIVIASLFLISDFAMIDSIVENKYPAKYEWAAAFGLTFTILWLYVKILDLLIQIVGNNKN